MRLLSFRPLLPLLLGALLAACGGSGSGSSSALSQPVVATGAITGFGSVYVNGVHFETDHADIRRGDSTASQGELRVGQMVHVSGHIDDRTGRAQADSIRQHNVLEGPVSAIDAAAQTFTVLAHVVMVTPETSFDDSLGSFANLTVGMQVEVSGMPDADGNIVATRVEPRRPGETELEVLGRVAALEIDTRHFQIADLVVDYSTAVLRDFGAAGIADGQLVEVKGNSLNGAGELVATEVEQKDFEHGEDGFRREIEGLVTRFVSASDFDVSGRPVTTTSATRYEGGTAADIALNVKLEAEGSIDANGVLVASKIQFKRSGNAGIAGVVESVTPDATGVGGTLTVLGVTITVDQNTRVEDKSDARIEMFHVDDLAVGDYVIVRGTEPAALQLTASRLERRRMENDVWVRGTVRDVAEPNFTVLGVAVTTNGSTSFQEGWTQSSFFATGAGQVAKVKGVVVGNAVLAREVEREDSDD